MSITFDTSVWKKEGNLCGRCADHVLPQGERGGRENDRRQSDGETLGFDGAVPVCYAQVLRDGELIVFSDRIDWPSESLDFGSPAVILFIPNVSLQKPLFRARQPILLR